MTSLRIALMTHGTRGDVQPLAALGRELARRGHRPILAVPSRAAGFVRGLGLEAEPLAADWQEFLTDPAVDRAWLTSGDRREMLDGLRKVMGAHAGEISRSLIAMSQDADVIVSGVLTEDIATVLDKPVGTIKTWLHRARLEVLDRLRQKGMVPDDATVPETGKIVQ